MGNESLRATRGQLVLVGVAVSLACGALTSLITHLGLVGAAPLVQLSLALVLFKLHPEPTVVRWSYKLVLLLCCAGAMVALVWAALFAWGNTRFVDAGDVSRVSLMVGVSSAVIAAPIYEEKVVRHVLLLGAAGFLGRLWASVLVSFAFALVHTGAIVSTFLVSMMLCWLALVKHLTSTQRAVVHGSYNAMIMLWYFTGGYGLSS